jgi:hypothetical protein
MDNVKTKLNSSLLLFSSEAIDKTYKVLTDASAVVPVVRTVFGDS